MTIFSRQRDTLRPSIRSAPISTIVKAVRYDTPSCSTTTWAKMMLEPMPGASAIGSLAHSAISSVPIAEAMIVVAISAWRSMPAADRISGLTAMM